MDVKLVVNAKKVDKEDIRSIIQMIRTWELETHKGEIIGVLFDTDPQMTSAEGKEIFEGIFPEFEHLVELPKPEGTLLRLGARGVAVDGELLGTCTELTLFLAEASEEEMQKLQEAESIALVRIRKG